jgi:hypothetical protein
MPLCGFNKKMIEGIALYSEGLFDATIERGRQNNVDDISAVTTEVHEINLFLKALKAKYTTPDDIDKKIAQMIYGIAVFSGALFDSTLDRHGHGDSGLKLSFQDQVKRICLFLEQLEHKHQQLKKVNTPEQTMIKAVQWIDDNDK